MKTYIRTVNYYETDQMNIVHHSNYIRYFEEARTFLMEEIGCSYAGLENSGFVSPVVSVDCKYKSPVKFGDIVEIRTYVESLNKVKLIFRYEVYDHKDGTLRSIGHSEHGFLDSNGNIVSLFRVLPEVYQKFMAEYEADKE